MPRFLPIALLVPCLAGLFTGSDAFVATQTARRCTQYQKSTKLFSILDDINKSFKEDNKDDRPAPTKNEYTGANPFNLSAKTGTSAASGATNIISLRKTRMAELLSRLMDTSSPEQLRPILEEYKDFLLEPLEDDNAVLDPDSIYTRDMNRDQRYQAYRSSTEERLGKARNPRVKIVLTAMKEYVLEFE